MKAVARTVGISAYALHFTRVTVLVSSALSLLMKPSYINECLCSSETCVEMCRGKVSS